MLLPYMVMYDMYEAVHFSDIYFSTASEGDILFTKEFISPVCLAMRVSTLPQHMMRYPMKFCSLTLALLGYKMLPVPF